MEPSPRSVSILPTRGPPRPGSGLDFRVTVPTPPLIGETEVQELMGVGEQGTVYQELSIYHAWVQAHVMYWLT